MAGHSKWANIQHRKGRQDAKRGKIFTKIIKEITVSARLGGGDTNMNPRLRAAVALAKEGAEVIVNGRTKTCRQTILPAPSKKAPVSLKA